MSSLLTIFLKTRLKRAVDRLSNYDVIINNASAETQLILPCLRADIIKIATMRNLNSSAKNLISHNSEWLEAVVTISLEMKNELEKLTAVHCPIHLISNCTLAKTNKLNDLTNPIQISYVGRISEQQKNLLILPDVVRYLKASGLNFKFSIVGDGPDKDVLENKCQALGVWDDIKMMGSVSRDEAKQILSQSHFTIIPSYFEGLSNVMLEAMALGCVPVISDIANFSWVLGNAAPELQARLDAAESYANRIVDLSRDKQKYSELQMYLQERQKTNFSSSSTISGYLQLIKELERNKTKKFHIPFAFNNLKLPSPYNLQCTNWWRILQLFKDLQVKIFF